MTAANQPQQNQQAGIQIIAQYIKDMSFENPNAPESIVSGWPQPETSVNITLQQRPVQENMYETVMGLKVEAKNKADGRTCFIIDLSYGGLVHLQNIPAEQHQVAMMVEVPKQLFPFAREIIAGATAKGGFPPLYLTPISFEALYVNEMKRQQQQAAAGSA